MPSVHVTVTRQVTGKVNICPFSHARGLQFYTVNGIRTEQPVLYKVPAYSVSVAGGSDYDAVRFGLQYVAGDRPPARTRHCDAGISHSHVCTPHWNPTYSPHSFDRINRMGAWRLFPGKTFYIHEGPVRIRGYGGSLGCIEILDGYWNDFLAEIERIGKNTCHYIAKSGGLKVTIESAHVPVAELVE